MKFLVGADGSQLSERAFEHAVSLLHDEDHLFLINIIDPGQLVNLSGSSSFETQKEFSHSIKKEKEEYLSSLCHNHPSFSAKKVTVHKQIISSLDIGRELCEFCQTHQIDMLLIGVNGSSSQIERSLIGSTSTYCVHNAPCTVYVIRK